MEIPLPHPPLEVMVRLPHLGKAITAALAILVVVGLTLEVEGVVLTRLAMQTENLMVVMERLQPYLDHLLHTLEVVAVAWKTE